MKKEEKDLKNDGNERRVDETTGLKRRMMKKKRRRRGERREVG